MALSQQWIVDEKLQPGENQFGSLFFGHFYRKEVRIKPLSSKCIEGVVVGYKRAQIVAAPIVEYIVDGQTYRNSLKYYRVVRVALPWKTNQAASDIEMLILFPILAVVAIVMGMKYK